MKRELAAACCALAIALPTPAAAFWPFGPGNAEDCIQEYAVQGATKRLVRVAVQHCRAAFDPSAHSAFRKRSLCIAKRIPELKSDAAFPLVQRQCAQEAGIVQCGFPTIADPRSNTCRPAGS